MKVVNPTDRWTGQSVRVHCIECNQWLKESVWSHWQAKHPQKLEQINNRKGQTDGRN